MKKAVKLLICIAMALVAALPYCAFAQGNNANAINDTPVLKSISFKNALIEENFSPYEYEYSITLQDPTITPTLEKYEVQGNPNILVTYILDEAKHQTGISVTLQFENGSTIYTFNYVNAQQFKISSNNLLSEVNCNLGEVYPKINDNDTEYKLYIPSDLTQLILSAATKDISAHCDIPGTIMLKSDQEPTISVTVTASDSSTRTYNFKIKRLNKNIDQVSKEMAQPDFVSLVEGELFYQKPIFFIIICSTLGGIIILSLLITIAKRFTLKVIDIDENEFFNIE